MFLFFFFVFFPEVNRIENTMSHVTLIVKHNVICHCRAFNGNPINFFGYIFLFPTSVRLRLWRAAAGLILFLFFFHVALSYYRDGDVLPANKPSRPLARNLVYYYYCTTSHRRPVIYFYILLCTNIILYGWFIPDECIFFYCYSVRIRRDGSVRIFYYFFVY